MVQMNMGRNFSRLVSATDSSSDNIIPAPYTNEKKLLPLAMQEILIKLNITNYFLHIHVIYDCKN